ncbi:hypothetical protein NDU88_003496 [Pleurodeles waltl]|uniref:Uncharacterized protein n=1 Tax=Pleurodeles waltl TaxID=8319 RepID=A0AAV7NK18_PLEWA|nr:hypothetical protein NDU88_003496 [Pleurodeles waltl]
MKGLHLRPLRQWGSMRSTAEQVSALAEIPVGGAQKTDTWPTLAEWRGYRDIRNEKGDEHTEYDGGDEYPFGTVVKGHIETDPTPPTPQEDT